MKTYSIKPECRDLWLLSGIVGNRTTIEEAELPRVAADWNAPVDCILGDLDLTDEVYFFAEYSRTDKKCHVYQTYLDEYSMTGDYLLFDTAEECAEHYRKEGKEVIV